jgi:hypothetical protein
LAAALGQFVDIHDRSSGIDGHSWFVVVSAVASTSPQPEREAVRMLRSGPEHAQGVGDRDADQVRNVVRSMI